MKLSANQAARQAGVSRSLVYAWCRAKRLRHLRAGAGKRRGKIVIEEEDLAAFLKTLEVLPQESQQIVSRHFS